MKPSAISNMTDTISKLTVLFTRFPGIGPRQARRFVYFLLSQDKSYVESLLNQIKELRSGVNQCPECFRYYMSKQCELCYDTNAEQSILLIVEKDADLDNIRKTGNYHGRYFVLGGLLPILEEKPETRIRNYELGIRLKKDKKIKEVIIALSANTLGDHTLEFLRLEISKFPNIKISTLGRGLSTGSELEYADGATLSAALESRRRY